MIRAKFRFPQEGGASFTIRGHAGFAQEGEDIVCAAVSSAAYMAANTVTEILGAQATANVTDGNMEFSVTGSREAANIVKGLRLHLSQLAAQYPDFIQIKTEE